MSDLEIAQKAKMIPISVLAKRDFNIESDYLDPIGHYKAKISLNYINSLSDRSDGHLILVTAISPTPAGEGKTTTTVGLGDALNRLNKKTLICLREPSLGPCFGIKGGAAGGGYSQIVPMEDINLHFTGDFHAIGAAHNLLSALIDNHIHHGNELQIDPKNIHWKRVMDMNDRALREIVVGMGGSGNGYLREDGFDIVVASEVMAILCLSTSWIDLKNRLGKIIIGYKYDKVTPIYARDLKAHGAMAALLKDAFKPNFAQTLENNLAIIHGGPFANIAHGCNSVIATKTALKLSDYVVTEAGFGADLGAEKFIDIKCRKAGLKPEVAVLVATVRALKFHGEIEKDDLNKENLIALKKGFSNLERHFNNIKNHYGLPCVVCLNKFTFDTENEIQLVKDLCNNIGVKCIVSTHWADGGVGAEELAHSVIELIENNKKPFTFVYESNLSLWEKIVSIATKLYGASEVKASIKIKKQLELWDKQYNDFPVCIAKTQMSFSTNPLERGAPSGHSLEIRELRLAHGAEFIIVVAGDIMTMPGLPKRPAAERIDIDDKGMISGLS